jgi:ATP-dependent Lon protease
MSENHTLPVLPLRETVIFPGTAVPISAGRAGTLAAVDAALAGDRRMLAVAQRENRDEVTPENLYDVGTIVRIAQVQRGAGGVQLLIHGEQRGMALHYEEDENQGLSTRVREMDDLPPVNEEDPAFIALFRELRERGAELGKRRGIPAEMLQQFMEGVTEPGPFADLLGFYVEMGTEAKQKLLEILAVEERMRSLLIIVQRHLALIEAQEEIQAQVQEELGDRQREMLLREQMKAIQRELGEEDEGREIEELREKIEALELPEAALEEAERELSRLERTNPQSAEYQVIRTYLEWITDLPWNVRTEDSLDLVSAEEILHEDHYGLEDVKDRVLEFLAVRQLAARRAEAEARQDAGMEAEAVAGTEVDGGEEAQADDTEKQVREAKARATARGPILLFAGPPGVGKTSIAKSIARALGRKYVRLALGGIRDEADIRGHRRTYVGAMPGRIVQALKQAKSRNPVILLDEVDKLGVELPGRPVVRAAGGAGPGAEPRVHGPLPRRAVRPERGAVHRHGELHPEHPRAAVRPDGGGGVPRATRRWRRSAIAERYLLPRQVEESGPGGGRAGGGGATRWTAVISEYTREAGVRQLERELGKVARKAARRIAAGDGRSDGAAWTPLR